jgi:uncharacterized protein YjiS (DUF1127 family)
MAHATHSTTLQNDGFGLFAAIRSAFARMADDRKRTLAYRKTRSELEQMTDKDLADIGIARFMIRDIAAEAAARA